MPCQRHIGPHVDASLLFWQRAVALLPRSCRCFSSLVVWCLIQFFRGLPGFHFVPLVSQCTACLGSLVSSIRRKCPSHLRLLSFMMTFILSSPVLSAPWPSRYWLCLSTRCPLCIFGTCNVQLLAFYFVQLLEATLVLHVFKIIVALC